MAGDMVTGGPPMVENVTPKDTFEALAADPDAQLVDVRTDAEWQYVGLPDLRGLGKRAVLISWQYFPSGNVNPSFVELYFLCRSGVRSLAAAQAAEAAGFAHAFNIAHGFEGPPDAAGHRGRLAGWKADALPWRQ